MPGKRYEPRAPRTLLAATAIATATVALAALVLLPAMLDNSTADAGALAAQLASVRIGGGSAVACAARNSPAIGLVSCAASTTEE